VDGESATKRVVSRWPAAYGLTGDAYEAVFEAQAAAGQDIHGEARLIYSLGVHSVLDGGCGTGRVGRELARRGLDVVGVDIDPRMLDTARRRAPQISWVLGDLADVELGRTFDAIVLAGNVLVLVARGTEGAVVTNMARHLPPDGLLVAGFQFLRRRLSLAGYDALARTAGLELVARWAGWDRSPWVAGSDYAVSVHRRRAG
jgi:SAM-dependent methyltransferase